MEVKIQISDNCELIKNGDTYIVKEKKNDISLYREMKSHSVIYSQDMYLK